MDATEKLLKQRTDMLQLTVLGFSLWQGSWLAFDIFSFEGVAGKIVGTLMAVGAVMYALSVLRLIQLGLNARRQNAVETLSDELSRTQQYKAFFLAYFVVGGLAAGFLGLVAFVEIDAVILLRSLIIAAVITPLLVFLRLDHKAGIEGT